MKTKLSVFLLLIATFFGVFTSCSSDNDPQEEKDILIGEWKTAPVVYKNEDVISGPAHIVWNAPNGTTIYKFQVSEIPKLFNNECNEYIAEHLSGISFAADGKISIKPVSSKSTDTDSKDLLNDFVSFVPTASTTKGEFRMLIYLNLQKIASNNPEDDLNYFLAAIPDLKSLIVNGIPVNYRFNGDNCLVYIDKSFISNVVDIIVKYKDLLTYIYSPEEIKAIIEDLPNAINVTQKLEIGLNLTK